MKSLILLSMVISFPAWSLDGFSKWGLPSSKKVTDKVLSTYPKKFKTARSGAKKYIPILMDIANRLEIDQGVLLSVAWIESNWQRKSRSWAKAEGIMQVKPSTGRYIRKKFKGYRGLYTEMRLKHSEVNHYVLENLITGAIYLKHKLREHNNNYTKALVAYNEGSRGMRRWVKRNKKPLNRHNYINKIRKKLKILTMI